MQNMRGLLFLTGFIFSVPASYILYIGMGFDGDKGFVYLFSVFLVGCPISLISIPIAMAAWAMGMYRVVVAEFVFILSLISIIIGVHVNGIFLNKFVIFLINFVIKKAWRK